jgi:hypothetical protein
VFVSEVWDEGIRIIITRYSENPHHSSYDVRIENPGKYTALGNLRIIVKKCTLIHTGRDVAAIDNDSGRAGARPSTNRSSPPKLFWSKVYKLTTPNVRLLAAMLTEHFIAGITAPTKANTGVTKDAGIFLHEYQPLAAQRHVFKKSATAPNGIAVSSSHVFAAQADKAIVHVYSREKGNQEAIVPFPERIHSIALAAQDSVLLLGTGSGRILAWEVSNYHKRLSARGDSDVS